MADNVQDELEDDGAGDRPVVTFTILAIILGLFVAMAIASHGQASAFPDPICDLFGDKINGRIVEYGHVAQWWRFVTPIFLHGGLLHVLVNSYSLYILGRQLEPFYGSRRFFVLFMLAGIAGVAASFHFSQSASLGASGALFGLIGAGIVFPLRFRGLIPPSQGKRIVTQLVIVAAINLGLGLSFRHYVDNSAHIGGLLGGGLAALFLLPDALDSRIKRGASEVAVWATCAALAGVTLFAATAQARWALGPWWQLDIPAGYHKLTSGSKFDGEWKAANGTTILITDIVHNRNLVPVVAYLWQRPNLPSAPIKVGGFQGRAYVLVNPDNTSQLYLIQAYDRIVIIRMVCPPDGYGVAGPVFNKIFKSFRFLHAPPPDLHPVPIPTQSKGQKPLPGKG